jgi:hypothetical protein
VDLWITVRRSNPRAAAGGEKFDQARLIIPGVHLKLELVEKVPTIRLNMPAIFLVDSFDDSMTPFTTLGSFGFCVGLVID